MTVAFESGIRVREGPGVRPVAADPHTDGTGHRGQCCTPWASQTALTWGLDPTASISQADQKGRTDPENLQLGPSHNQCAPLSHLIPQDGGPNKEKEQSWGCWALKKPNGSELPPDAGPCSNKDLPSTPKPSSQQAVTSIF